MAEVLFQLSGSIAAYKACQVISRLVQAGCSVQPVATRAALEFVGPATLEGLTGRPVATDAFAAGTMMDHIHLVRRADLVVLCPATANTINRLACGIADDLIGTMFLAFDFRVPYVVVPAMNTAMYEHPATLDSIERLRRWGVHFVEPSSGSLACGEIGPGRLAEPDDIVAELLGYLSASGERSVTAAAGTAGRRILITAGGTKMPIDGVRAITNTSTGRTGAVLAAQFDRAGYNVTLLHASDAVVPNPANSSITLRRFTTYDDFADGLFELLRDGRFDAVVHLAAVSDYDVDQVVVDGTPFAVDGSGKLETGDVMEIHLKRTPKLLEQLKRVGGDRLVVVGFKLTNGASPGQRDAAVRAVSDGTDLVVHNDLAEMTDGRHPATVYRSVPHLDEVATVGDNAELAAVLQRELSALLASH